MHSLDRDLLIIINDVARAVSTRFDQAARAAHGMSRAQWIILFRLDRQPGISQNELAAICEVEPITVARLIDRLEARGLIERRADSSDRRINRLHLLPVATPFLTTINATLHSVTAQVVSGLDESARATLFSALMTLKDNLASESQLGVKPFAP